MNKLAAAAAAIVLASTGGALAASQTVTLTGFSTNCSLIVHFNTINTPLGQQTVVTTRPSGGDCVGTGDGIGAIGTATVGGNPGQFLVVGQGVNHQKNTSLLFVLQLTSNNKLQNDGSWGEFQTQGGKTATFVDGGVYTVQ